MDFITSVFPNVVILCTQLCEGKTKDYLHKVLNKPHVSSASEKEMAAHSSILAWENPMDRGAWQAMVHRVAESRTRLKRLRTHARTHILSLRKGGFSKFLLLERASLGSFQVAVLSASVAVTQCVEFDFA